MSLEALSDKVVRIGSEELPVELVFGGRLRSVSVDGEPGGLNNRTFSMKNLRGVRADQIPVNFTLNVSRPKATTPGFEDFSLANFDGKKQYTLSYYYQFENWHWQQNLNRFVDAFKEQLSARVANHLETRVDVEPEGILLWCEFFLESESDCYQQFVSTDRQVHEIYTQILEINRHLNKEVSTHSEQGVKWWVRYAIVPIITCGAVAAVVGWLLSGR